uniref:Arylsulfatase A n=1 Tax=Caligus clemensi TaxID=344056 RepID=C1C2I1_CALCM|nr:Arylsulfatase A precursor [Caligus clemensi]
MCSIYSFILLLFLIIQGANSRRERPNIILFIADDLGYGDLSSFGHPTSSTHNIDELAAKSLLFTNYYSASPLCSPSRAAILAGEYPARSGIYPGVFFPDSTGGLDPSKETITKELRRRYGYKSALIGKWHLGVGKKGEYLPTTSQNFDYYYGIPYAHDMCPCHECFAKGDCLSTCHDKFVGCPLYENNSIVEQPANLVTLTQRYTNKALKFLSQNHKSHFFLTYSFHQAHHPQFAGPRFHNTSSRGAIGDALMEMDDAVGTIIRYIKKLGLRTKTLVLFTSDNGPSLQRQERGGSAGLLRCGKGTTYEGGMRVPFLMHWSGFIMPRVSHALITALDIYPTLMSIISVTYSNSTDGYDFTKLILKNDEKHVSK